MSALLSVTIQVKNPAKLQEYISQVPATMEAHGSRIIGRGKLSKVLHGDFPHQMEAYFEFPSSEAIDAWFNSDAYQALIGLREEAAHMNIAVLEPV